MYATGGVAFNDAKIRSDYGFGGIDPTANKTGWVLGAGAEYAVTPNIVARVEYLYKDYGSKDRSQPYGVAPLAGVETDKITFRSNTVRAGVAYKF